MKKHLAVSLAMLCLLTVIPAWAFAQEFRATVNGRVMDQNKAAVPNATISLRHLATNEVVTVTSNSEGNYTASFLKPGIYTIAAEASGLGRRYQHKRRHTSPRRAPDGAIPVCERALFRNNGSYAAAGSVSDLTRPHTQSSTGLRECST